MRYFADYIKGKPYQKTVLWENSSPTSNFSAQTVTLSDDVTNYDEIQIISYNTTTDTTTRTTTLVKSDLLKATEFAINEYITSVSASFNRYVTKQSNTSFLISTAYRWNTSSTTSNAYIIPIKIIGIKKGLGEIKNVETINKNAVRSSSFTAVVGHRYIVAFASLYGEGGTPSAHITGLDVITASNIARTAQYSSLDTTLQVVIGVATSTTVTCTHRIGSADTYSDICAIDLDDQ